MLLGAALVAAYRLVGEGSARRLVTNLFGMHVSPAVVADILKQDDPRGGARAARQTRESDDLLQRHSRFYGDERNA